MGESGRKGRENTKKIPSGLKRKFSGNFFPSALMLTSRVAFVLFLVIAAVCSVPVQSDCDLSPFEDAGLYNLYSLSSVYGCESDVEGRVAANGPIFFENYSVGLKNQVNEWYSLVSSSVINFTSGAVWHGGVIGSSVDNLDNVGIMIDGTTQRSNECCSDAECDVCVSTEEASLPIDFERMDSHLLELSLFWIDLPATEGSTVEYLYQSLTLTCASGSFNHFTGVHLEGVTSIEIICEESASVVIDYTIETVAMQNLGITLSGGISASKIIHHFCGPTLTISGVEVLGVVFAPWSDVYFPQGLITGQVFAGAFIGSGESVSNVSEADNDECGKYGDGHAIITAATGSMVFDAEPQAVFVQNDDGTATITGVARNGDIVFNAEAILSAYTTEAPAGSPKEELKSECYISNGGNVNPATWEYYEVVSGTLTGAADSKYEGAVVSFTRKGPAAQVGLGANGKNQGNGLSFWFDYELVEQSSVNAFPQSGYGDFNLDANQVSSSCPKGQINRNPFDGCVPSMRTLVCCRYASNGIENNFCAENVCATIPGWDLVFSSSVDNCQECTCPQA